MNDVKSLLIATTVLAIGGLGLYMYKTEDSEYSDDLYLNDDKNDFKNIVNGNHIVKKITNIGNKISHITHV